MAAARGSCNTFKISYFLPRFMMGFGARGGVGSSLSPN